MAVLGRLLISSAERLDLPDLLSIDSYSAGDWRYFIDTLVGEDTPYIIKGFDVVNPGLAIGTQSISINIADSAMYYPGSGAGSFFYGLPAGNPSAQPLVPSLILNATNYIYLTFTTFNTAEDTRSFWDPNANGGTGDEFTQEVNTESVIQVQVNVSTGSFPSNTVPVAIVAVGATAVTSIEDARPMMFRLGTGGISPNPANRFAWPAIPSTQFEQMETPITITSSSQPNPFQGGDKNITSLKEWMDAVMSQLANLGGTQYWYEDISTFSLISLFNDLNITFYSKGKYQHSSSIPGRLTWTEDLVIKSLTSPVDIIIRAGTINIPDENVAYISPVVHQPINVLNQAVLWANGSQYINTPNGSIGYFSNLHQGDFINAAGDPGTLVLQVVQFYSGTNGSGSVTTPANAKSVLLSGNYQGSATLQVATFDKGIYLASDVIIQSRSNPAISAAGGNFIWLVLRSDTIENIGSVSSVTVSGTLTVTDGTAASPTGTVAEVVATAHGLVDGDRITVTAPVGQAGTYTVEVINANTFFFNTTSTAAGAFTGFYGLCTTAARFSAGGWQVESANNGFESGETINIAGTTNFNGEYVINFRTATQFEFPIAGLVPPSPPPGSPVLATAASYALLANSTITNVGSTVITGNLGLYPGTSVTGFPPGTVSGLQNITNTAAMQAEIDALAAYTDISTRSATVIPSILDGQTLNAGVYRFASGSASLAASGPGTLTFNGSATDIFVIQTASTLTTGAGGTPTIAFTGGALASNVYWAVGSSATLNVSGTGTFQGTLVAHDSITLDGGSVNGSLWALNAAITISNASTVTTAIPVGPPSPETSGTATLARLDVRSEEGITKVVQGETIDIGEGDSDNIQRFIGMSSLAETYPDYFTGPYNTLWNLANYNGNINDNLTARVSKLTAMMADKAQDKTIKYLCNAVSATNTVSGSAQQLTFLAASSTLTILQPGSPGNAVISLPSISPGISLLANQSAYVIINRNAASTPSIVVTNTANIPIDENVIVIASRLGDNTVWLWNGENVITTLPLTPTNLGLVRVGFYDPVSTALPTGSVVIDGISIVAGQTVLFSALSSGINNAIYMANGTGGTITGWTVQYSFNGNAAPANGDTVIITSGNSFGNQVGEFNGTTWTFNATVRYFNGINYYEQDAIAVSTLTDNTVNGTVTSYNYLGSEYAIIDFSIHRGVNRDTGTIFVTTDGTNVKVAVGEAYIGDSGVSFTGAIVGGVFYLYYTTTSTGVSGTIKFMVRRWSDAAGGPAGVPSYSGSSSATTAAGPNESIQYNSGGLLDGSSNFLLDTAGNYIGITGAINLNGLSQSILSAPITLLDNQSLAQALFSYPAASFPYVVIEYSVVRDGFRRLGRLLVANDGTITSESDDYIETAVTGVVLSTIIVGSSVVVKYTTTSTGFNGTFKYSGRAWS